MLAASGVVFLGTLNLWTSRNADHVPTEPPQVEEVSEAPTPRPNLQPNELLPTRSESAVTCTVHADQDWQDSGVIVKEGAKIAITYASGAWTINVRNVSTIDPYVDSQGYPGKRLVYAPLPDQNAGGLVGRIGGDPPFWIGRDFRAPVNSSGALRLRINDEDYRSPSQLGLRDNDGTVMVLIELCS